MKHFQLNKHNYINLKLYLLSHTRGLAMLLDSLVSICTLGYIWSDFSLTMCRIEMKLTFKEQQEKQKQD